MISDILSLSPEIRLLIVCVVILTAAALVSRVLDWVERGRRIMGMKTPEEFLKQILGVKG